MARLAFFCEEDLRNFNFYKFPKALFTEPEYKELSDSAKILYMIFYDRLSLSQENRYYDEHGVLYIYYSIKSIMAELGWSRDKVKRAIYCLEENGLIVLERQSLGVAYKIYVSKLVNPSEEGVGSKRAQSGLETSPGVGSKQAPNKTNNNNTNKSVNLYSARARVTQKSEECNIKRAAGDSS
jgi:biotin operon repressor